MKDLSVEELTKKLQESFSAIRWNIPPADVLALGAVAEHLHPLLTAPEEPEEVWGHPEPVCEWWKSTRTGEGKGWSLKDVNFCCHCGACVRRKFKTVTLQRWANVYVRLSKGECGDRYRVALHESESLANKAGYAIKELAVIEKAIPVTITFRVPEGRKP